MKTASFGGAAVAGVAAFVVVGVAAGVAVVAAGAVVTSHVAPHTMVGGVPARLMRKLNAPPVP